MPSVVAEETLEEVGHDLDALSWPYVSNRYYDPSTAQFLTVDPLVELTESPFRYVGGNPLNYTDPAGLSRQVEGGGGDEGYYYSQAQNARSVGNNRRGNQIAKEYGYEDAHDLKDAYGVDSKSDIYVDANGNLFIARKGQQTNLDARDYLRDFQGNVANTKVGPQGRALCDAQIEESDAEAEQQDLIQAEEAVQEEAAMQALALSEAEAQAQMQADMLMWEAESE